MPKSAFERRPPPLVARWVMGVMIDGLMRPMVRVMDRLGRTERMFGGMRKRQLQRLAANSPFKGYTPTEHDVFVAVYIKSGTNWTMQIAHQILNHGNAEYDHIHSVIPWPDTKLMGGPMQRYAIPLDDDTVWRTCLEQRRVIKTHFQWSDIPYSEKARYILVIRDPKDVFVSSYFFFGSQFPLPSVETWYKLFCSSNGMMFGSWAENAAGYWAQRHRPNVLLLSFKRMKQDLPGTVRRVADFLNVELTDEEFQRVCEKSSFNYMKRMDEKFEVWKMIPWRASTSMMRKGAQGGSSELLTPEKQQAMDEYFIAELKRLGSDLPYEEFCDLADRVENRAEARV
jgi:hypothetical protein